MACGDNTCGFNCGVLSDGGPPGCSGGICAQ
jgi:hypothetical protein